MAGKKLSPQEVNKELLLGIITTIELACVLLTALLPTLRKIIGSMDA